MTNLIDLRDIPSWITCLCTYHFNFDEKLLRNVSNVILETVCFYCEDSVKQHLIMDDNNLYYFNSLEKDLSKIISSCIIKNKTVQLLKDNCLQFISKPTKKDTNTCKDTMSCIIA